MTVTYTPIKYGVAGQKIRFPVYSKATGNFQVNPTIAAGDIKRSLDGGVFASMDALPIVTPAGGVLIECTLSAAEASVERGDIVAIDQSDDEWDNAHFQYEVTPNPFDTLADAIGAIGSGTGAALNFAATGDNTGGAIKGIPFVGVQTSGTYASTAAEDGTYHVIDDDTNEIDIIYSFSIGAGRNAAKVTFKGYLSGNGDTVVVKAYNFSTSTWDTRATILGQAGSTNITRDIALLSSHTGTGAEAGVVYVRFNSTATNQTLRTDELLVAGVSVGQTVGYSGGAIWVDTNAANVNTTPFIDGTADNPVATMAVANTLATSVVLHRFEIAPMSSLELIASQEGDSLTGQNWALALGGQSISGTYIYQSTLLSGIGTCANANGFIIQQCNLGTSVSLSAYGSIYSCSIGGTLTLTSTAGVSSDVIHILDCFSGVAGSGTPTITAAGVTKTTSINVRNWFGGGTWVFTSNCTASIEVVQGGGHTITTGGGNVEFRGSCRSITLTTSGSGTTQIHGNIGTITINGTGGTVNIFGAHGTITNNSSGTTINDYGFDVDDIGTLDDDAITAAKFDESTAFPLKSADSGTTLLARMTEIVESGKTLKTVLLDLWAVIAGNALANDATSPTTITYDSPDDTVQVTHTETSTTRTVS